MKNTYLSLVALAMAAASLSSCSRTNYAFNPKAPSYLGTTPSRNVVKAPLAPAPAPAAVTEATVTTPAIASAPVAAPAPTAPVATRPVAVQVPAAPVATAAVAPVAAAPALAATTTPTAKPNLVQRLMLKKVLKRLTKIEARQQNTAGTAHTAAKASLYLGVAAVGLVLLIIGLIASSGFLDTVGGILIVVGLIIFIFNNV